MNAPADPRLILREYELDGRRRTAALTPSGEAFGAVIGERLRGGLARAYRTAGLNGVAGTRRILAALAGGRTRSPGGGV